MSYLLSQIPDSTSMLRKNEGYLRVQDTSWLPAIDNYSRMYDFQVESISQWTPVIVQIRVADRQLEQTFNKLAKKWKRETMHFSLIQQIVSHQAYLEIIGLGKKAIPLILCRLKREPDFWFSALRALTTANPITEDMRGDVMAMRKAWLDWGKGNGYF